MGGGIAGAINTSGDHAFALWEKRADALMVILSRKGLMSVDELRSGIEGLGADAYESMGYYERWIHAITETLIRRGVLTLDELGRRMAEVRQQEEA